MSLESEPPRQQAHEPLASRSAYREDPFVVTQEVERLEKENAKLREWVAALVVLAAALAALAGWWFGTLGRQTGCRKPECPGLYGAGHDACP